MKTETKKTNCQLIFDSLIEQDLIPKEKVKEMNHLGNIIYNFLYFGSEWQAISDELHDKLTLEKATEQFKDIYDEYNILQNDFYLDRDCECVLTDEPTFDEEIFNEDYKEEIKDCCCKLSKEAFINNHMDMFYSSWIKIECRELFREFLGPDTYEWIFI